MKKFEYTVKDPDGIHARPAGLLVKEAGKYACSISIEKGDKTADLKRIFSVMSLGVKGGETVTVTCDGADEQAAAAAILQLLEQNL